MKKSHIDKKILEIVDKDLNLIGGNNTPELSTSAETQANGTTDQNIKMSRQQHGDDFLGRFGYYFYEGEEEQSFSKELIDNITELEFNRFRELLFYFMKNKDEDKQLQLLKIANKNYKDLTDDEKQSDVKWARKILSTVVKNFSKKHKLTEDLVSQPQQDNEIIFDGNIKLSDVVMKTKFEDLIQSLNMISKNKNSDMLNIIIKLISLSNDVLKPEEKNLMLTKIKTVIENR